MSEKTPSGCYGGSNLGRGLFLMGVLAAAITLPANDALAQIVPDDTLGNEGSVVTPNVKVDELPADRIDGGATRGANLFHSFSEFNVTEGGRVYFANPAGIDNILGRVTGTDISDILGTLGVDGGANLFLLNPNGIVFGPNARLDVSGSFVASTADSFVFGNGVEFSATNPEAPPLLTINLTPGLQYGANASGGTIANTGNLAAEQNLTLTAGNLDLQGQLYAGENLTLHGTDTVRVRDSATHPFIAAAGDRLLVQGNQSVDIFALNHPDSGLFSGGDMVLRSSEQVGGDARYWSGSNFRIEQLDGNLGDLSSPDDPIIRSVGDVSFNNYIGASLHILAGGSVTIPGFVIITGAETGMVGVDYLAEEVTLSNGDEVTIDGSAIPTLDIRAGVAPAAIGNPGLTGNDNGSFFELVNFFGFPFPLQTRPDIQAQPTRADINIGTVAFADTNLFNLVNLAPKDLLAGQVLLTNQYKPNPDLEGDIQVQSTINDVLGNFIREPLPNIAILTGDTNGGGSVDIDSRGKITLDGLVSTTAIPTDGKFGGNGGDVTLLAEADIDLIPGTFVASGGLLGGKITFDSGGTISLHDSGVASLTTGAGQGGGIAVNASDSLEIVNVTGLTTEDLETLFGIFASDTSDAENLRLSLERLKGSGLATVTAGAGDAGDLLVNTSRLIIHNEPGAEGFAGASASALGGSSGNSGNLTVNASEFVEIVGNEPGAFTPNPNFGTIFEVFAVPTGLTTVTTGSGDAGNLTVNTGRLTVRDGAAVTSGNNTFSTGSGGDLSVDATELLELQGKAVLGTATVGSGDAGSIAVEAGRVTLRDGAVISADTVGSGDAGELEISTTTLEIFDGSRIGSATADEGLGATLTIDASDSVQIVGTSADGAVPSGLFANTLGISDAGNINLETGQLLIQDGGMISTSTSGPGNGGDTAIAAESVSLINNAAIVASTTGRGDAGDIKLQVDGSITLVDSAILTALQPDSSVEGFESGDFTGWAVKGDRSIETSAFGSNPTEGTYQALLTNTFSGNLVPIPSADLETFLGLAPGSLEGLNNGNAVEGTAIKTTFTAQAGDVITLDWHFLTDENTPTSVYNDFAFVTLVQTSELADTGFPDGSGSGFADSPTRFASQTGFQTFTATIPTSGTYTLGIGVVDVTNTNENLSSGLLVDRVSLPPGTGSGGDIDIQAQSLTLTDGSQVEALTRGRGNSGNIRVDTSDFVELSGGGLFTSSETANSGRSGNISVNTGQLVVRDGAVLNAQTQSINDGGDITVDGRTLTVTSGGQLRTTTSNSGDAGDITLNLSERAVLSGAGSGLFGQTAGAGTAGNLTIDTPELFLQDRAQVSASTSGTGRSGNIFVQNAESVRLTSQSAISTEVEVGAAVSPTTEPGGDIDIQTQLLSLTDGARVTASTSGRGDAGNIAVGDAASVFLANDSVISTAVNFGAIGQGGDVAIQTDALALENNAQILASTDGQGDAGNINADGDRISLQGDSQISAATAGGEGGSIILRGNALDVRDGSRLSTTTAGSNDAGNIEVKIADGITLTGTGSGFFASTEANSTGNGGSILTDSRTLTIREGAGIAVDSQGTGVGGSVQIQAESATLEEQAFISAETTSNTGGDLTLQLRDYLLLRHNSRISTTAGTAQAGGDGGNIGIDTDFIIAVPEENSDITANAFEGRGGNINITAQGIYGIEFRDELTPLSDITASSELGLDGEVSINTPGIEPDRGLANLPGEPRNLQPLEGCQAGAGESGSRFISTGRGGLPSSPTEPLGSSEIWEDVQPPSQQARVPPERIVEAEGWRVNDRGEVVLVAQSSAPSRLPCDR